MKTCDGATLIALLTRSKTMPKRSRSFRSTLSSHLSFCTRHWMPITHRVGRAASRLALTLFDSLPSDKWLKEMADNNQLDKPRSIRKAAERMAKDVRCRAKTLRFIRHWFDLADLSEITKNKRSSPATTRPWSPICKGPLMRLSKRLSTVKQVITDNSCKRTGGSPANALRISTVTHGNLRENCQRKIHLYAAFPIRNNMWACSLIRCS